MSYAHTCGVYFTSKKGTALYLQGHSLVIFPNQQSSFRLVFSWLCAIPPEEGTVFLQSVLGFAVAGKATASLIIVFTSLCGDAGG